MASQTVAAEAFCPAHITGFFKAHVDRGSVRGGSVSSADKLLMGSTGAGFSLATSGVTTRVVKRSSVRGSVGGNTGGRLPYVIATNGYPTGRTDISRAVVEKFLDAAEARAGGGSGGGGSGSGDMNAMLEISHWISAPVGYGLGSSGAAALSLAYALDGVLGTGMSREEIGGIAHAAEIDCRTGLGDVLASYHGGFEIRTAPGAPGIGSVEKIATPGEVVAVMICLEPVSTSRFISEHLSRINGLGGRMIEELKRSKDYAHFQDMSLQFADHIGVITPRMREIIQELVRARIRCGVALFGQTVFCMAESGSAEEKRAWGVFDGYRRRGRPAGGGRQDADAAIVIKSKIDKGGARLLHD